MIKTGETEEKYPAIVLIRQTGELTIMNYWTIYDGVEKKLNELHVSKVVQQHYSSTEPRKRYSAAKEKNYQNLRDTLEDIKALKASAIWNPLWQKTCPASKK
jgi:hypothetical protein